MTIGDDTTGGFLAPTEIVNELIKGIVLFSPIREVANVRQTSFNSIKAPKRTATSSAVWVGEVDSRTETNNPKFGKEEISTRELSAMADVSRQDLQDVSVNLDQLVLDDFEEQFGVAEGLAFVSGDGVDGKPEGIRPRATRATWARTGSRRPDGELDLDRRQRPDRALLRAQGRVRAQRDLADEARDGQGRPAAEGDLDGQLPVAAWARHGGPADDPRPAVPRDRRHGRPDAGRVHVAGDLPIAFGDFRRGYWIVDRLAIQTLRDPYTQAGNGYMRLWAYKRVGGQVVLPEAIKLLRVKA
jgi:predicted phage gp36 major capsid-like protein